MGPAVEGFVEGHEDGGVNVGNILGCADGTLELGCTLGPLELGVIEGPLCGL